MKQDTTPIRNGHGVLPAGYKTENTATIVSGTLFHRYFSNGQAMMMGVLELSSDFSPDEGTLYPMNIHGRFITREDSLKLSAIDPHGEPFENGTIDSHLTRKIWPSLAADETGNPDGWFFAVVLPLDGFPKHVFFYAALPSPIMSILGDAWYSLQEPYNQWIPRIPLADSKGEKAITLCRKTYWPIDEDSYWIDPIPEPLRQIMELATQFYMNRAKHQLDAEDSKSAFEAFARRHGFSDSLIDSIAGSIDLNYTESDFIEALEHVERKAPIHEFGRMVPEERHKARLKAFEEAVQIARADS